MLRTFGQKTLALTPSLCAKRTLTSTTLPTIPRTFSVPEANSEGKFWKITLHRSSIGLHPRTRENALALGLKRRGHVAYRPINNEIAGMILKLKEIVRVEMVDKVEPLKKAAVDGFEVIGRMNPRIASGSKAAKPLLALRKRKDII
ncbi:ATP citrate lyase subunit 1 [Kickxella alabastrina]|uniref:ATP citrate lyase subunit 1 n=1 Tax=Kickxella alabastrina TaxID=61397 RepID=A0ACC1I4E1_9FUNG|nr:ATP citrate lyase subunit 1 [Kickxella alabastrina]